MLSFEEFGTSIFETSSDVSAGDRSAGEISASFRTRRADLVRPGTHRLEVDADGHQPWRRTVEIPGGEVARPEVTLKPQDG